jgi:hypothetical protein
MKKANRTSKTSDQLRPEYRFDYTKSRANRFANESSGDVLAVVLDPDVAKVFETSESVNNLLRSVITAIPKRQASAKNGKRRRKAS